MERGPLRHIVGVQFRLSVMGDQIAEVERPDDGFRSARAADSAAEYEDRCRRSGCGIERSRAMGAEAAAEARRTPWELPTRSTICYRQICRNTRTKKTRFMCGKGYDPTRHQTSWSTAWENLKAAAGMKNFRFHDLRHTFITQGIEDNVPVEVMMAQVGYVFAEMTRYYTHLSTGAKDSAVQKIAARNQGVRSVLEMEEEGAATGEQSECGPEIASDPQSKCASHKKG